MRTRLATSLAALLVLGAAARAPARRLTCARACRDVVAACVATTGAHRAECRRTWHRACRLGGVAFCMTTTTTTSSVTTSTLAPTTSTSTSTVTTSTLPEPTTTTLPLGTFVGTYEFIGTLAEDTCGGGAPSLASLVRIYQGASAYTLTGSAGSVALVGKIDATGFELAATSIDEATGCEIVTALVAEGAPGDAYLDAGLGLEVVCPGFPACDTDWVGTLERF